MSESSYSRPTPGAATKRSASTGVVRWLIPLALAVAVVAAYAGALHAPFIFDDYPGILRNPSIRDLGALGKVLLPEPLGGSGIDGRPVANLTLAINYAIGGEQVVGYHLFNLGLHVGSVLLLFGTVRRWCALPRAGNTLATWPELPPVRALTLAAGIAALWGLHPLLTEPVVCTIHRTDGLAGLFLLGCFYCLVRLLAEPGQRIWAVGCWIACALGMASKETMAAAPLLLFLFDRAFGAGSFAEAWRRRRGLYLGLASTWGLLAAVMLLSAQRGGSAGFGLGMGSWDYLLTQCWAIVHYLRLAVWPYPLVIDYGDAVIRDPWAVWPQGLLLIACAVATVWAIWRRPVAGFLGAWFFGLLAPSSSIVPLVTQTIAERRMYLPLLALVVVFVAALVRLVPRGAPTVLLLLAGVLGGTTFVRCRDYRTEERIWAAAAEHRPKNYRIHYSLGQICDKADRLEDAIGHYREAIRLKPTDVRSHYNLAAVLATLGRLEEAREQYEAAWRLDSKSVDAVVGLGSTLMRLGRPREALACFREAREQLPESAKLEFNLGQTCYVLGSIDESILHYRAAVSLEPSLVEAHERLGGALATNGDLPAAEGAYRAAVRLDPLRTRSWANLGVVLCQLGRPAEAIPVFEAALRSKPGDATVERYLAIARAEAAR